MQLWITLPGGRIKRFQNRQSRCRCAKRRKGKPRVGYGLCHGHEEAVSRTVRRLSRAEVRKAEREEMFDALPRRVPRGSW